MDSIYRTEKVTEILSKGYDERTAEQVHYLSMAFKKKIIHIENLDSDWCMMAHCIRYLHLFQYRDGDDLNFEQVAWIYVLDGSFQYHGMIYKSGEYLSLDATRQSLITLKAQSKYAILSFQCLKQAKTESENRRIEEQKNKAKSHIFRGENIKTKAFNIFWQHIQVRKLKKHQKLVIQPNTDFIFFVFEGSVLIQYSWKRPIKVLELGPGSLFSTYLGRYIKYRHLQSVQKYRNYDFQYFGCEDTLILEFNPDIFYENERLHDFRYVIDNVWLEYEARVQKLERMTKILASIKPEKKEVVKSLKEGLEIKELRERAISVPVIIQRRKLCNISFNDKSNRRKIANITSRSINKISCMFNPYFRKSPETERISGRNKSTLQPRTQMLNSSRLNGQATRKNIRSRTECVVTDVNLAASDIKNKSILFRNRSIATKTLENPEYKGIQNADSFFFFQKPEFLSRKLKLQYKKAYDKLSSLKLPVGRSQLSRGNKTDKIFFEDYINERRIVKLGPKKRLLYKRQARFLV